MWVYFFFLLFLKEELNFEPKAHNVWNIYNGLVLMEAGGLIISQTTVL